MTFAGKVMSLLFNMLSRLVIALLPRCKRLLISWLQSPSAVILEPPPKKSLDVGKEVSEKSGLKLNIQKTKIMASGSITSWQIEGGKVETVTYFIFLGSKITVDSDCSSKIKTFALGRKAITNLDNKTNTIL